MKRSHRATSGNSEAKKPKEVPQSSTKELCLPSEEPENKRFNRSMDLISQLPHDILVFILSLLSLKEAAKTSTLSRRWRCLWSYIPCLNFDAQKKLLDLQLEENNSENEGRQYVKWVSQVIDSYKGSNLETLRIRFSLDSRFQCDVDRWVQFANKWNLKMFELNLSDSYDSGQYNPCSFPQLSNGPKEHFPRVMFSNSSSLTTLKLIAVNVGGEVLEGFLTNCPLLEVLCVKYSHCLVNLRVVGASLKLRQLEVCMCNYLESLEISAPNLESFKYVGPWLSMPLKNAPKLLETYFGSEFGVEIIDNFFLLSSYSSQLQKLVLDLEVDFMENQGFREWPLLANLKELELIVIAEGHSSLIGFTSLIKASPCLQKFSLKLDYLDMFEQRALRKARKFPHQHIKVVELAGFVGKPIDLELVRYFHKNAVALEEIVFDTRKPKYMGTIFEKKQNTETLAGRECANSLQSSLFSRVKVTFPGNFSVKCFSSDEFPVDESFLENFGPKDKETEDEARKRNWIERGWAPWEEVFTPEADFARKSLNEGEEVPLQTPEAIEAFKMLSPKYRKQKMEEMGLTEDDYYRQQCEIKGEIPEPLETTWTRPLVLQVVPPRDWPPRGWDVDREELEFIREAHKLQAVRVDLDRLEKDVKTDTEDMCLDRYKVFLKQYKEWVAANKDRLEEESYKYDQDYHPGRRKRGKDYKEGMYELPFYYPGQICEGKVTTLHLYQGAFVDIGGVYDGWVPIKGNDWYWIRHHIKVGMPVIVEILAKRDPYRFRFPIEMRFVHPNIDHLVFNRFDYPPIFHRDEDSNPDEVRRDCRRPPIPRKDPGIKPEDEALLSNHPYVDKLWQIHVAEQMILDDLEMNPDKYKDKKLSELSDEEDFDDENSVEYTKVRYKNRLLPKMILKTSVKELDLEAAFSERQVHNKLRQEAQDRGEEYKITKLRRNIEMDEYDLVHWRRSFEEREALIRDISCRQALGLPLEEPGRYVDASYFGKDQYDPTNPLYRYDYWGEPKNSEKSKQERMTDAHNKSIVGKGVVWYEMSYEDAIKERTEREARSKVAKEEDNVDQDEVEEDDDDDDDFDFSILRDSIGEFSDQPHVNGTESSRMSDEGMFEN